MPAPRHIPALVAAALALLVAGCGDSGEGLLSAEQAAGLTEKLDAAQQALDNDRCLYAQKVALEGADEASQPRSVDAALQRNLVDGFNQLAAEAENACAEEPEETPTPTAEATEVPTEAPTEAPTEVPTEAPTEAPTEEPTVEETPTVPPLPTEDGSGGAEVPTFVPDEDDDG